MISESKILKFARMKKIAILFMLTIFLWSCETEFEVNAPWKDVTIVYGLLEANKDTQYVKVCRAFLGEEDALIMASNPDSIYYSSENVDILINEYVSSGDLNNTIILKDTFLGDFTAINGANPIPNKAYYFNEPLNDSYYYELIVAKKDTIRALTSLVEDKLIDESDNSINFMSFTNPENYGNMRLSWDNLDNGVAYEVKIRFFYEEFINTQNGQSLGVDSIEWKLYFGVDDLELDYGGESFFSNVANKIVANDSIKRLPGDLKIIFTVAGKELFDYYEYSQPSFSVLLEKPDYEGNVEGGYGVFSSRIQQEITRNLHFISKQRLETDPYTIDLNFFN